MNLTIKKYSISDAPLASQLIKRFKEKEPSPACLDSFLANPQNYLIAAEIEGEPVGFLLAYALERFDQDAKMIYIHEIEVAEKHRRKGIGKTLIEELQKEAERDKIIKSFILTNEANLAACELYEKTGAERPNQDDILFVYQPKT
jgi:ribosomal protein S18 acetylase RimI-like enzyme